MIKDLKKDTILMLIGAVIAAAAFLGNDYFEEKNRKQLFAEEIHKQLYDKGANELAKYNDAYSELMSLFSKDYALTSFEMENGYKKLQEALLSYGDYVNELQRYGNSGQVQTAQDIQRWMRGLYADFHMQYGTAQQVQKTVRELLLNGDPDNEVFKVINESLENGLDRLIQQENWVYYEAGEYKRPMLYGLEQYLNYQFRLSIGLSATADMAEVINNLPERSKRKPEREYKDKELPFMFAENRVYQTPNMTFTSNDHDKFHEKKNALLKEQVKIKFIALVIENDKNLQQILKDKKAEAEKG